ncbi:hypothetical protein Tco_0299328 [Tanacetum coccineum]
MKTISDSPSTKNEDLLRKYTKAKPSIEEPPELELKDLPSHLDYAYFEENDKLPVIIAKGLKDDEKDALLKVLKSHKRAIAWKITDIKGEVGWVAGAVLVEYMFLILWARWVRLCAISFGVGRITTDVARISLSTLYKIFCGWGGRGGEEGRALEKGGGIAWAGALLRNRNGIEFGGIGVMDWGLRLSVTCGCAGDRRKTASSSYFRVDKCDEIEAGKCIVLE